MALARHGIGSSRQGLEGSCRGCPLFRVLWTAKPPAAAQEVEARTITLVKVRATRPSALMPRASSAVDAMRRFVVRLSDDG